MTKLPKSKDGWKTIPLKEDEPESTQVLAKGATSVKINYGGDKVKTLKVTLTNALPEFEFDGMWSGKDINIIIRHIRRAYLMRSRELRREGLATFNPKEE